MNTNQASRILAAAFCILALFLASRLILTKTADSKQTQQTPLPRKPLEATERTVTLPPAKRESSSPPKTASDTTQSHIQTIPEIVPVNEAVDPDEAFMKRIASLPLDRANLETRLEVERRIKADEKKRARLIFSENIDGKHTIAYAVKQPSMQDISRMLSLYQRLLDSQTTPENKAYVDQRFQFLAESYAMTDGNYHLLYAVIPETAGGTPIRQYCYAASSEQECMDILRQELAPKPPMQIGVPVISRQGQASSYFSFSNSGWRMDQLIPEEITKPFYYSIADIIKSRNARK